MSSSLSQSNGAAEELLRKSGIDFRAARKAANEVGAQLVLGDRPLEITLERAWELLTWKEKTDLFNLLKQGWQSSRSDDVEMLKTVDMALTKEGQDILQQYEEMLQEYIPTLLVPLIQERDIFLSLSMKSSMAVNGCKRVVGVVGRAHLDGVMQALSEDHSGKFKLLTRTRRRAAMKEKIFGVSKPLAQRLAFDAVVAAAGYAWWRTQNN
eukprot:CAMPEP_0167789064 /NCGR_PEP_ID=MMETSP0111_2-20121227/10446_1 /TAXON_ID=91324 /ORGANISM="Lotharella globosa, Strain CCCM811" /LENGTH=209 /DNA_ID=CAMNT_0007681127 /DNA_START=1 /DNA_END=630 /DNA_ORIENTATION=-